MKHLYKIMALFLLLAVAGGQFGYAQNYTISVMSDTTVSVCDSSFAWYGITFSESGNYAYPLDTVGDTIRVDSLHLTINHMTYGDTIATACGSFSWHGYSNLTESGGYTDTLTNAVGCDSVVTLHLTIHHGTHNSDTVTMCGSYLWHGTTYTTDTVATYEYTSADGCSCVDTLHLTINNPKDSAFYKTACESYVWTDGTGETYTSSGTYLHPHEDDNGCWQVDTLHLTINHATYGDTTVVACESFTWHGITYTETPAIAPTYTIIGGDHNGCDSIVTLHLAIHHGIHNVFIETVCESYSWHGTTYTASGTYTYPYNNEYGCPSEDTLHLTVNYGTHNVFAETACESYTWHGTTYAVSGIYTYLYTTADGCASADTLHLIVNHPVHTATSVTMCDSYTWAEGTGQTYTTSGTYTYAHQDSHGCMQVDTLHLVINPSPTPFIVGNSTICYDEEATLTAVGGETYQWSTEDVGNSIVVAMEGLYTVTATNMHGCSSTAEFIVNIAASPLAKKDIIGKSHADGSYYMLVYPEADLQYQWYKNNVVIEGATKQYYYPSDYTFEGSLDLDACYQVAVHSSDPDSCGIITDCWMPPTTRSAKIHILPNPNDGQFRLLLPEGTVSVQVLNANGQTVMTREVNGVLVVDMTTNLANGLYFVKIFRQDGSFNTEKLIINR